MALMKSAEMDLAQALAKAAGEIMRKNFTLNMKKEWKADKTPVTQTDLDINALVLKEIKAKYPDHSILAEEGDDFSADHEHVWICDPVDGTHNFSHGIPTATFALALTKNGESVLSAVYDPFLDRLFTAERGKGAMLNGAPMHVSRGAELKHTVIGMGKMTGVRDLIATMSALRPHGPRIITGLSIHYMCALVAAGEFSATFFGGDLPHDITASALLVEEAGGRATDLFGKPSERMDREQKGLLVSNGVVHDALLGIMESAGA